MENRVQSDQSGTQQESTNRGKNETMEWIKAIVIAVVFVFLIRWFIFAPFIVDGPSMKPNFHTGERIIVNKIIYDIRDPKFGEVVVFHVPSEGRDFIKRVIGVPGDEVKVEGDTVMINGQIIEEPYIQQVVDEHHSDNQLYNPTTNFPNDHVQEGVVPEGHLFVLGDNRPNSTDSRMIGYIPYSDVIGRADVVFWPLKDAEWIKHYK